VHTLATLFASSFLPGQYPNGCNLLLSTVSGTCDAAINVMFKDDIIAAIDGNLQAMLIRLEPPPPKVLRVKV
jgi:hypothetical protein